MTPEELKENVRVIVHEVSPTKLNATISIVGHELRLNSLNVLMWQQVQGNASLKKTLFVNVEQLPVNLQRQITGCLEAQEQYRRFDKMETILVGLDAEETKR